MLEVVVAMRVRVEHEHVSVEPGLRASVRGPHQHVDGGVVAVVVVVVVALAAELPAHVRHDVVKDSSSVVRALSYKLNLQKWQEKKRIWVTRLPSECVLRKHILLYMQRAKQIPRDAV